MLRPSNITPPVETINFELLRGIDLEPLKAFTKASLPNKQHDGQHVIYMLFDAREPRNIRYVGMSARMRFRWTDHKKRAHSEVLRSWIKSVGPHLRHEVIAGAPDLAEARRVEKYWIGYWLRKGASLLNVADKPGHRGATAVSPNWVSELKSRQIVQSVTQ